MNVFGSALAIIAFAVVAVALVVVGASVVAAGFGSDGNPVGYGLLGVPCILLGLVAAGASFRQARKLAGRQRA